MSLTYTKNPADKAELTALFGGKEPTWPPPNLLPSTEQDYWFYRSIWFSFKAECWLGRVQMGSGSHGTAMLFYVGSGDHIDGGFAVINVYSPSTAKRTEYFTWSACVHEWASKTIGNCNTRYTCTKCGKFHDVDSSD